MATVISIVLFYWKRFKSEIRREMHINRFQCSHRIYTLPRSHCPTEKVNEWVMKF